ncbi:MAG: FlgD immunoglobulin-like domain containing protein [Candidatus Eisenbacteria bacterium]
MHSPHDAPRSTEHRHAHAEFPTGRVCPRSGRRIDPPVEPTTKNSAIPFWERWITRNTVIAGVLALAWLVFRTGTKPSRVVYPCQQAAISTANLAFGAALVTAVLATRRRAVNWFRSPVALTGLVAGVVALIAAQAYFSEAKEYTGPVLEPPRDYRPELVHVTNCPDDPAGDRFLGIDNLLLTLGQRGTKLLDSGSVTPFAGPGGIVGNDDVVLIKINYQWSERGGTNMDVLRGLIRRIVDHPDGFVGEIVIVENAQFASTNSFNRSTNNAQDQGLSPHDIVVDFQEAGVDISHFDWTPVRYNSVSEYSEGDMNDGYIVYPVETDVNGRPSYPKFQTDSGTYISLKNGVWDPDSQSYSKENFRFINLPVLKSHHAVYGATVSVKHYMGLVTRELSTNSHSAIRYGILGRVLGEIGLADLNILDAIWINADPYTGPGTTYAGATRRNELVAAFDPVALDIWAVKNILIPGFESNGFSAPWPSPSADPDDPSSAFRTYLDNSMSQLLDAGYTVTNDLAQIDVVEARGDLGDFDQDGDVDESDRVDFAGCFTGEGGGPLDPGCVAGDFDRDDDVDCEDWLYFREVWTEAGTPGDIPDCDTTEAPLDTPNSGTQLLGARPNPMTDSTTLHFVLAASEDVSLRVFDASGRIVRTLVAGARPAGANTLTWDGRDDRGNVAPRGTYTYALDAGERMTGKVVIR